MWTFYKQWKEYHIISNNKQWNNNSCEEIFEKYSLEFQPTMGWIEKLGNKYVDRLAQKLADKDVYILEQELMVNTQLLF